MSQVIVHLLISLTGFTALTEKMAGLGDEGIEKLTGELNSYFGKLIEIIYKHGGDIVKVIETSLDKLL
jgi:hypothetical protein